MNDVPDLPDPRMIQRSRPRSWFEPEMLEDVAADFEQADQKAADRFLRPFIMTEGRTRPLHEGLRVETLVHALPSALSAPLRFERRQIVELCQTPLSLAEIAAALHVPLGVARVLVADLATSNLVSFAEPEELPTSVIERIRDLVQAL